MPRHSVLIHNARIWTGDRARSRGAWAASMRIVEGRVVELDSSEASAGDLAIDAGGRVIAPGLIDAHLHLLMGGASLAQLDLRGVRSRQEFEAAIAARHAELPEGAWLIAHGWAAENWPADEGEPGKAWLAAAGEGSGGRPVVCYRMDLHAALVNDAVLRLCDLRKDPVGGRIVRDANGEPTGLMVEAAAWRLINPLVPEPAPEVKCQNLREAQRHLHSLGVTAVGSMEYARDVMDVYLPMREALTLRCAITLLDRAWPMDFSFGRDFARNHPGNDRLAVIGYKAFADGTLGSRTARLLADYADDPGNRGMLVELAAEGHLREWAHAVAAAGLSPSIHAIGDEAVRLALDAVEELSVVSCQLSESGTDNCPLTTDNLPRIEHAQQIDPLDFPRFRRVIASMQPLHKADDGRYAEARLGPARIKGSFPFRQLLDAGATLAFGSDWPVVSCDPIAGMRAAIIGLTLDGRPFRTEENLTVEEALHAYTAGAAGALGMHDAGTLVPGAAADFVVFDRDPFTADWIDNPPRIEQTYLNGEIVYDGNEMTTSCGHV